MGSDPARAAEMLSDAAQQLQGAAPAAGTVPADLLEPGAPMTAEQFQRMMDERLAEERHQREVEHWTGVLHDEAKALGYDPGSNDKAERARYGLLIDMARDATDGDLAAAHELVEGMFQARIAAYVAAKRDDSRRPSAPTAGGSPSTQREITTLPDADAAVEAYLDAQLGPDPRRR
jgi:hypothetical protein